MTTRAADHKVVVQISDTHIVGEGLLNGVVDTLDNVSRILEALEAGQVAPDLLLFSGDLADIGEPAAYERLRALVERLAARMAVPALYVPGNHDLRRPFRKHLLDWEENDETIDQVVWVGDLRVIGLDSTVLGAHRGEVDDAQLAWLTAELATPAPLGTLLALHHPPIRGPIELLNDLIVSEPHRLAEVIAGTDVKLVVAGHTHHGQAGILGGVPVSVATASAYQIDVLAAQTGLRGLPGSAFSRIDVSPEGMVATEVMMLPSSPVLYEFDLETLTRLMRSGGDREEVERVLEAQAGRK